MGVHGAGCGVVHGAGCGGEMGGLYDRVDHVGGPIPMIESSTSAHSTPYDRVDVVGGPIHVSSERMNPVRCCLEIKRHCLALVRALSWGEKKSYSSSAATWRFSRRSGTWTGITQPRLAWGLRWETSRSVGNPGSASLLGRIVLGNIILGRRRFWEGLFWGTSQFFRR